jgi:adenylate cyclase
VVLLIDDVHWIDPESNDLLAKLVEAVGWTRTLLLLNFRPEYRAEWMTASYHQRLQLAPLTAEASDALLRELVGDDPSNGDVRAMIQERAEGNPFFIEEIVQSLVDQGMLASARSPHRQRTPVPRLSVRVTRPVDEIRIPATVQSLLAARIDGLSEFPKEVLQVAAVIGKRFSLPVLRLALGANPATQPQAEAVPGLLAHSDAELAQALGMLQRADLIHSETSDARAEYGFKHPLTQEVAYNSQLQETRARKHEVVARALEVVHADRLGEYAPLLAHHWEAANKRYEARLWRRRAALHVTNIQVGSVRR